MKDLSNYRESYEKSELLERGLPENPIHLFAKWFQETEDLAPEIEANAMTLSTIDADGFPKSRVVLLKQFTEHGFVFFTNYNSIKGQNISKNQSVCLSFFWPSLQRQVIVNGNAEKTSAEESDLYFNSRPEGSKLGAIASNQSEVVPNRQFLEDKLSNLETKFHALEIPRPEHWGGYLVKPISIEFWQGRANRLHDRIQYKIVDSSWIKNRLSP